MISIEDINKAAQVLKNKILKTSLTYSSFLSEKLGCEIYLKLENLQLTGSYKVRGAINKLYHLSDQEKKNGVIACSAGNHAQGVAYAAKQLGIKATIVMPTTTPFSKIEGTKKFGAEIILHGNYYDDSYKKALALQKKNKQTFIHPFNDKDIIAGQGTIGLEIYKIIPDLDMVIIPIGGGGLISGVSTVLKTNNSKIQIIGVESEKMPSMKESIKAGKIITVKKEKTIADGIAISATKNIPFKIIQKNVDNIVSVDESSIAESIIFLLEQEKILAEGAGASGLSAILSNKIKDIKGKKIAIIITGGNIDLNFLDHIITSGLSKSGRLHELKIIAPNTPGSTADLTAILAKNNANIYDISHDRIFSNTHINETAIKFRIETKGHEHIAAIISDLKKSNFNIVN